MFLNSKKKCILKNFYVAQTDFVLCSCHCKRYILSPYNPSFAVDLVKTQTMQTHETKILMIYDWQFIVKYKENCVWGSEFIYEVHGSCAIQPSNFSWGQCGIPPPPISWDDMPIHPHLSFRNSVPSQPHLSFGDSVPSHPHLSLGDGCIRTKGISADRDPLIAPRSNFICKKVVI